MRYWTLMLAALLTTGALAIDPPKPRPPATPATKDQPTTTDQPATAPATPLPPASARPDIADDEKAAAAKEAAAKQAAEDAAVDAEQLPPLPADAASAGPPAARFNPTEKVRADFPVSFPIDI